MALLDMFKKKKHSKMSSIQYVIINFSNDTKNSDPIYRTFKKLIFQNLKPTAINQIYVEIHHEKCYQMTYLLSKMDHISLPYHMNQILSYIFIFSKFKLHKPIKSYD